MEQTRNLMDRADYELGRTHYPPKKLSLIYALTVAIAAALSTGLSFWLDNFIEGTGGLSGIGMRTVLQTVQSGMSTVISILMPFWMMGFYGAALTIARGNRAEPDSLFGGFRRFAPILRLFLLFLLFGIAVGMAATYVGSAVYMMTPGGSAMMTKFMELSASMQASGEEMLTEEAMAALSGLMEPAMIVIGIVVFIFAIPLIYRYRMALFAVMDGNGARKSLFISRKMMRRRRIALFKMDLQFWWYYVLTGVLTALCYGDMLLDYANVTLPVNATVLSLSFYGIYLAGQFLLQWQTYPKLMTSYAMFYLSGSEPPRRPQHH